MKDQIFHYQGKVRIYLQGEKALQIKQQFPDHFSYYLGSRHTRIQIRDFRPETYRAVQEALIKKHEFDEFADIFCQPADVTIHQVRDKVQIDICSGTKYDAPQTLWLGVVTDGNLLPLTFVDWEVFQAADNARTGFAALIPD